MCNNAQFLSDLTNLKLEFAQTAFNSHLCRIAYLLFHDVTIYNMSIHKTTKRITTHVLLAMKQREEKIAMLTAYDYSMARILDSAGIDILLIGDSASNVMAGHETTLPITLDQMIYHAQSVVRAAKRAFIVVDLPFGSYQGISKEALAATIRS